MDATSEHSNGRGSALRQSMLRYPLRSSARSNAACAVGSSDSKRGKSSSDIMKSVSVLDLSAGKTAKPPRRNSIPAKVGNSPCPSIGNETPVSAPRTSKYEYQDKNNTPKSDMSLSFGRRKFNTICSASYWMTQIKLAEAASKHSISLGFFKLALESGCEPINKMCEELKAYISRHGIATELEDAVKDVLHRYNIAEEFEKLKVSPPLPKVANQSNNTRDTSRAARSTKLNPRSLNSGYATTNESNKNDPVQKGKAGSKVRNSHNNNVVVVGGEDSRNNNCRNYSKKTDKESSEAGANGENCHPDDYSDDQDDIRAKVVISHEDKENMNARVLDNAAAVEGA